MRNLLDFGEGWTFALAVLVTTVSSARLTRLFVNDTFPPVLYLRMWWDAKTAEKPGYRGLWNVLLHCPWCFGPWATALVIGTAIASNLHPVWWVINGWLAISYVASWIVFHDEDGAEVEHG